MKKYLTSVVLTLISAATFAQASSEKSINQINNGMPNRISMNVTVAKQTQGATFGEKVNAGLHSAGSAVASGASLASAPGNPIGGIIVKGAITGIVVAPPQAVADEHRTYTGGRKNEEINSTPAAKGINEAGIKKNSAEAVSPGQPIGGIVVKGGISQ
jgi:Ni/Co efflux regulator RcnB